MLTKQKRLILLAVWFVILAAVYWGFGNTRYTMPITYVYFALCFLLSLAYLFINGGLRPIYKETKKRKKEKPGFLSAKSEKRLHPVKKAKKYRRISKEDVSEEEENWEPNPNPFKIPEEKRVLYSQMLLIGVIPFYLIFGADFLILKFIV